QYLPMHLYATTTAKNVGTLTLETDAVMLAEAVVTAEAPQVQVVEDTLVYNSSAYRTPEGAMLEELVKKLPGAEIDDEGNVKINGKDLSKIMVDGKEFFGGDVKTGLKNLPVDMIEKLKTYDKKSDLARITGIDDGEEETVLDLTVKKGMNQGWFGNADVAGGTEDRYMGRFMLNRFVDKTQVSVVGSANNVNDQGFSGGGGGPRWRRNNGLTATKMLGVNFATQTDKLELGGSARYNYQDGDIASIGSTEDFLPDGNSYSNSNSRQRNKNMNFNADFRLEWKPDSMTNIIFRPNFSYGKTDNLSGSESGTFNADPYSLVTDPNNWLNLEKILNPDDDLLRNVRINATNSGSLSDNKSVSTDATLQLNRKLNDKGRNVTFRGRFGYTNNDNNQYTESETHYFKLMNYLQTGDSVLIRNQYIATPTKNYNYSAQLTYSEPIARATFLQFSYQFQYKYSESDKTTYDLQGFPDWGLSTLLPTGYEEHVVDSLGKYAEYRYYNHDASVSLRFIREKYQLSAGMSFQPQHSVLSYKRGDYMIDTTRNVFNFAPNLDLRIRFSKVSQLRMTYRGRSSQPSMENLLPIVDNSNPQNVRIGNPGLKPSFTHNMRFFYNTYNAEKQRGIMSHVNFSATQNSISNSRVYNSETGGWTTTPKNINGNWNAFGMFGFNTALPNKKYTINSFSNANYQNYVAYLTSGKGADAVERKNTTTNLTLGERLNAAYRNDWFEFGLNGSISYSIEKDKLTPDNNQEPYTFSYGANTQISMPWNMTLSTNIANQSRRGYTDSSMNRNELIWNAQLSQTFLKGNATVSFEMYDILKKQSNISRSLTASGRSVYEYNGVNSYCMLHFIYRLNIFGSKAARERMQGRRGFGGPGFGPGGPGGFGGRRPF
ncbi:outer membrane beta-barrel protein, partial [uncultured Bacteroides sp.]|uniref:outer membrane beta-barrel protein n=1 Tax=uncultured Bacteroides sp. TaxID=162156 RepID=UPI00259BF2B7